MSDLEKMQPRSSQREFLQASSQKWASAPKVRPTAVADCHGERKLLET